MDQSNPIKLLRLLKGAPLSVLIACNSAKQPVTETWLCDMTGYTDKPVASATRLLKEYGWVTKTRGGWMIANADQLPLTLPILPEVRNNSESRNNSDSSSSSIDLINLINNQEEEQTRKNSDFQANLVALLTGGIREPKASVLAALEHVTPEYIQAHLQQARRDGNAIGTAVYRIENAWDKPEIKEFRDPVNRFDSAFDEYIDRGKGEQ